MISIVPRGANATASMAQVSPNNPACSPGAGSLDGSEAYPLLEAFANLAGAMRLGPPVFLGPPVERLE